MDIRVLGRLEVLDEGRPLEVRRPMERALLTLLASEPGRAISTDKLIDGLWGESPPATANKTLQTYVHHLRSLLPEGAIVTDNSGYRLAVDRLDVDAARFSANVSEARKHLDDDPGEAAERLLRALTEWRGDPFSDAGSADWLQPARTRLSDLRIQAQSDAIEARIRCGRHEEVLPELRSLLEEHPLREDLWSSYMLALYRGGRQADALRAFGEARRRLGEELGIEPGPELQRLEDRILAQDPTLLPEKGATAGPEATGTSAPAPVRAAEVAGSHTGTDALRPTEQRQVALVVIELTGLDALTRAIGPNDTERIRQEITGTVGATLIGLGGTIYAEEGSHIQAVFGAPVAREDDTYRAIRAVLQLVPEIAEHRQEIGRTWGVDEIDIRSIVGTMPVTIPFDDDQLHGRVVPLEKVLSSVRGGSTLVDDHTRQLMGDLFLWGDMTVEEGVEAPLWEVRAVLRHADKARMERRLRAPLTGREAEMAVGNEALESLDRGIGGVLLVTGEAGVGKSRLVAEIHDSADTEEAPWLVGHCESYAEASPYWPFRDLLRSWIELGIDDTDLKARVALHQRLDDTFPEQSDQLYPYLGGVLGITLEPGQASRLDLAPEALQYRTFEVVSTVIAGLAERRPTVVVVEDLHWADSTSIQLIEHLLPLTEQTALLLVLTSRPDPDHPSHRLVEYSRHRMPHLTRELTLEPLSADAQHTMLRALIEQAELPPAMEGRVLRLAEGNPFYLEELVGSLVDEGALTHTAEGWRFEHAAEVDVPETVEKVVHARIDRLDRGAHQLLTAASVLGRSFGLPLLIGVLDTDADTSEPIQELLRVDLLVEARRRPQPEYLFKHVLIQEAAYRALPEERRTQLHRRAAQWLESRHEGSEDEVAGILARHWAAAGDEDRAVGAFLRAGDLARRDHALDEAIEHYRNLLPILERRGDSQTMAVVLFRLASALHTSLRFAESNEVYQRAFTLWEPPASPAATETLRYMAPPFRLVPDPVRSYALQDIQLQMALFDRLVERWPDDTLVPSLAESWQISDDGLQYRFLLREGLAWSDGHPLTAEDSEYGVKRNLDPDRPGISVAMLYVLEGAYDYVSGQTTDLDAVGVEAIDDRTVEFRLLAPAPYFLAMLNRPDCGPQPRHVIERLGDAWSTPENEVLSGAFRRRSVNDDLVVLERRPDYQGTRTGNVKVVHWRQTPVAGPADVFKTDRPDVMWDSAVWDGEGLAGAPPDDIHFEPPAFLMWVGLRCEKAELGDVRLRRALAHGIDRQVLAGILPAHCYPATGGMVPPVLAGHTPDIALPFDPERGKALLAGVDVPRPLRLVTLRGPGHIFESLTAAVAEAWRENLGLDVELVEPDPAEYGDVALHRRMGIDAVIQAWFPGYTDPEYFLRLLLHSDAADNFGGFSHRPFDELVEKAILERDERKRLSLFHAADRMAVAEEVAVIPLAYGRNLTVRHPRVKGWWEFGKSWSNFADLTLD